MEICTAVSESPHFWITRAILSKQQEYVSFPGKPIITGTVELSPRSFKTPIAGTLPVWRLILFYTGYLSASSSATSALSRNPPDVATVLRSSCTITQVSFTELWRGLPDSDDLANPYLDETVSETESAKMIIDASKYEIMRSRRVFLRTRTLIVL